MFLWMNNSPYKFNLSQNMIASILVAAVIDGNIGVSYISKDFI